MLRLCFLLAFLVAPLWSGCSGRDPGEPLDAGEIQELILEGKRNLSEFQGAKARESFSKVYIDRKRNAGQLHCEAAFGLMFADVQVVLSQVNPPLLELLKNQFGPAAAPASPDAGAELAAFWETVEPSVREIAEYAAELTAAEQCEFSIGLDGEPQADDFDYRFPLALLDNETPVAQVIFRSRFDALEARAVLALAQAALGAADLILAHDWVAALDAAKVEHQLGVTADCIATRGFVPCAIGPAASGHPPIHLLDWAFVFADNPRLLAASGGRWELRMPRVAGELAAALAPLRDLTELLLQRNSRLFAQSAQADTFEEFAIVYRDDNRNAKVDTADALGINVSEVRLDCAALIGTIVTPVDREECEKRVAEFERMADVVLLLLRSGASPSEAVLREMELLVERLHGALRSVDDPSFAYEPLPFSSLSAFFSELLPVINAPAPNFLTVDVSALFKNPQPLRAYLPLWQTGVGATGSRFYADADSYPYYDGPPTSITAVEAYLDQAYGGLFWASAGADGLRVDPAGVRERELFTCPGSMCIPADCLNAGNLYSTLTGVPMLDESERTLRWPALYLSLPDATFNGTLATDLGAWSGHVSAAEGNGALTYGAHACPLSQGMQEPDNLALQKSLWLFADFFVDHFQLAGLVFEFLDSLE